MRLGGPAFIETLTPENWIMALQADGYTAAYCPVDNTASDDLVREYADAARAADIVIAEVGAWSNPISADEATRQTALNHCKAQLALAERIGARCCVNIVGSRGDKWDGPCAEDLTSETFDLIVETTREIIDAVKPTRTFWTIETMPWMLPDSVDSYLALLKAVNRPQLAVHFDPANLINSPRRFFHNADLVNDFVDRLGPHIKSCHLKDVTMSSQFMVHIDEARPGLGSMDYVALLKALNTLAPDVPGMLEHLQTREEYQQSAQYIRTVASENGIPLY